MSQAVIEVSNLTKVFPQSWKKPAIRAVDSLSFKLQSGTVCALLGPNGSGKSTTLKSLLGLVKPTSGECRVRGHLSRTEAARASIGYLPEAPQFHRFLTGRELLQFYARLCGCRGAGLEKRIQDMLDWCGIAHAAERRLEYYSKGMLQRIGLAQAMVHDPAVLILDEPTAGMDPLGCADMHRLIASLRDSGKTVIICSHQLEQIEQLCDHVLLLCDGRLLVDGSMRMLLESVPQPALGCRLEHVFLERVRAARRISS